MAFQTRCPECNAKLRFDEAPDAEEAIECPRCGHVFDAADAKPIQAKKKALARVGGGNDERPRKKKGSGNKSKVANAPKKRKIKRKKTNPAILWAMVLGAFIFAPLMGYFIYKLYFSEGKIGILMANVPGECNWMRGIDVTRLSKYPGYEAQLKAAMTGPFEECRDEFAKADGGQDPKFYLDYAMTAKIKNGAASGTMHVFQTTLPFDAAGLFKNLGGSPQTVDGTEVQKLGAKPGALANAYIFSPQEKQIVVISTGGDQMKMLKASLAARANPKDASIKPKLGACGNKTSRANIWTLMRAEGDLKDKLKDDIGEPLKSALSTLSQKVSSAKMMGCWMYFGNMIKYGAGIECDSDSSADVLVKAMREGELGKQDDAEIPRDLVNIFFIARNKEFMEFMSNLVFKSTGNCAYLESKMTLEKSVMMLSFYNRTDMFEGQKEEDGGGRRGRR